MYDIGQRVEEDCVGRGSIAPRTTYLLIETLDALGHVVMDDPAHIALVDAHAEGNGGTDHEQLVVLEQLLCLIALQVGETSVVSSCLDAFFAQICRHLLRSLSAQAIDDAGFEGTGLDEV